MQEKLVLVSYAGDYREAFLRLQDGGPENYYAQRYSVNLTGSLVKPGRTVTHICCLVSEPYDEVLPNGIRTIGLQKGGIVDQRLVWETVKTCQPTHFSLATPLPYVLRKAIQARLHILVTLADSFKNDGIKSRIKNRYFAWLLNSKYVSWVGNHGVNSSRSLQEIGVSPEKIIPWDWPHSVTPEMYPTKSLDKSKPETAIFVGAVTENKGVGDAIDAVALLNRVGRSLKLKVVGKGDIDRFSAHAEAIGVGSQIEFCGQVRNSQIVPLMHGASVVLVPSRHEYPEGFPMTIYEALCSRTPIVASDHPMFRDKLVSNVSALVYEAGNPEQLANCMTKCLDDEKLYASLSLTAFDTWKRLQIPVKTESLLHAWLDRDYTDKAGFKLTDFSLAKYQY